VVARDSAAEDPALAGEDGVGDVGGYGDSRARGRQQLATTQVRHSDPPGKSKDGSKPCRASAPPRGGTPGSKGPKDTRNDVPGRRPSRSKRQGHFRRPASMAVESIDPANAGRLDHAAVAAIVDPKP